jgi:hypothetical protein
MMLVAELYDPLDPPVSIQRDSWSACRTSCPGHAISEQGMPPNCTNAKRSTRRAGPWPN